MSLMKAFIAPLSIVPMATIRHNNTGKIPSDLLKRRSRYLFTAFWGLKRIKKLLDGNPSRRSEEEEQQRSDIFVSFFLKKFAVFR